MNTCHRPGCRFVDGREVLVETAQQRFGLFAPLVGVALLVAAADLAGRVGAGLPAVVGQRAVEEAVVLAGHVAQVLARPALGVVHGLAAHRHPGRAVAGRAVAGRALLEGGRDRRLLGGRVGLDGLLGLQCGGLELLGGLLGALRQRRQGRSAPD